MILMNDRKNWTLIDDLQEIFIFHFVFLFFSFLVASFPQPKILRNIQKD